MYLLEIIEKKIDSSWENVQRGLIDIEIGSEIVEKMKTGEKISFVITDMNEEYIRVETKSHIGEKVQWHHTYIVDVPESDIYQYLHTTIWDSFPEELKNAIAITQRKYISFNNGIKDYQCKLFLPDPQEIFGRVSTVLNKEIPSEYIIYDRLEYYKQNAVSKKGKCWLNSGRKEYFTTVSCIDGGWEDNSLPWKENFVSICFYIKRLNTKNNFIGGK